MGIIQRQGIKDSIVTYAGVLLGAVNVLFVYPYFLKIEELGLFNFLISGGMILSLFIAMGANDLVTRYFPVFRSDDRRHNGFLLLMLAIPTAGFLLVLGLTAALHKPLLIFLENKDPLIQQYGYWIFPLAFFLGLNYVLINYAKNFLRIVIPTFIENPFVKVCTAILSVLLFYSWLSLTGFIAAIVLTYAAVSLGVALYIAYLGQWSFQMPQRAVFRPGLVREMSSFAFYSMLGGFSAGFLTWLDRLMISFLMEENALKSVGIFSVVAYIGMVIDVPRRSLEKISAPVVADAFQRNDLAHVAMLYRKASITQFIAGTFLFLLIWLNIDDVFAIMPNGERFAGGKIIVLILGMTALIGMVTGINHIILTFSKYYRINFYLLLCLAALNVVLNYLLIRTAGLGIIGAALATLISMFIFHLSKFWIIYRKLGMQPLSRATLYVFLLGIGVFLALNWLPAMLHPLFDMAVKSLAVTVLFVGPVLHWRLSPDLNDLWGKFVALMRRK